MPNQKKILVVVESIDVEDSSGSKANVALIQNLYKAGYEVVVYHYTRKDIHLENIKCLAIKERRDNLLFLLSRIQRKIQHAFDLNLAKYLEPIFGFSFTFFNDSKSIVQSLRALNFEPHLVISLSKGASFRPHHALLNVPELHKKWVAYIHDPYPFSFYPIPYSWTEPGNKQKIKFFQELSLKAQWVGFPSLLLKDWMVNYFPEFDKKSIIIPHQLQKEKNIVCELPPYFDSTKFSLLHAGNLMKQRSPFPLIEGFKRFLKKHPEAQENTQLLLLGNADYHLKGLKKLENSLSQLYISDGNVNYQLVLKLQEKVSVNIILESTADFSPFLPGKFPHCIAANKIILLLAPEKSEVKRLLGPNYHYHTKADNVEQISKLISSLYEKWIKDRRSMRLDRKDLRIYLSFSRLRSTLENLTENEH